MVVFIPFPDTLNYDMDTIIFDVDLINAVSNKQFKQTPIRIFPNPSNNNTTIIFDIAFLTENNDIGINIHNIQGKLVQQFSRIKEPEITLRKGELKQGMYFISLTTQEKIISTSKLIIY